MVYARTIHPGYKPFENTLMVQKGCSKNRNALLQKLFCGSHHGIVLVQVVPLEQRHETLFLHFCFRYEVVQYIRWMSSLVARRCSYSFQ